MRCIAGSCHCGGITFEFQLPDPGPMIAARACGCTFCRTHGGTWTSHPEGTLTGRAREPERVNRYRFGHGTADFYICRACGGVPFVVSKVDGQDRAVVNVNTFTNVSPDEVAISSTDFEGEGVEDRLARRSRNWIGRVDILP